MSTSIERSAARRFYEDILSTGDWSIADEIAAPELVMHHPSYPAPIAGRERVKEVLLGYRRAFPDITFEVVDEIGCGDRAAVRWHAAGTNTGPLFGAPPTGIRVRMSGITALRSESGRVVEYWVEEDTWGIMQQLGLAQGTG